MVEDIFFLSLEKWGSQSAHVHLFTEIVMFISINFTPTSLIEHVDEAIFFNGLKIYSRSFYFVKIKNFLLKIL